MTRDKVGSYKHLKPREFTSVSTELVSAAFMCANSETKSGGVPFSLRCFSAVLVYSSKHPIEHVWSETSTSAKGGPRMTPCSNTVLTVMTQSTGKDYMAPKPGGSAGLPAAP